MVSLQILSNWIKLFQYTNLMTNPLFLIIGQFLFNYSFFEKPMYNHLIDLIEYQNTLYKFQFGFRKHFSPSHAIISLVEQIRSVLTSGKFMIGVFLDLKKTFDTVNHATLI